MSPRTRQSIITFPSKKNTFADSSKKKESGARVACKSPTYKGKKIDLEDLQTSPKFVYSTPNKLKPSKNATTPSSAFATLKIESPSTTNSDASSSQALFSLSDELPCRENELENLQHFLMACLINRKPGSMYISGLPGTGKTAALLHLMEKNEISEQFQMVLTNCTAVRSATSIYQRIASLLGINRIAKSERNIVGAIEKFTKRSSLNQKMILLVLDEIDQLTSKFQTVLYKIFEWPTLEDSRLVLIGIANAVDLTDRVLPRLKSLTCQPQLLHFKPYTKEQIVTILRHRLAQTADANLFGPGSLELISAKVAGQSGDLRRALDLGRRVLEVSRPRSVTESTPPTKLSAAGESQMTVVLKTNKEDERYGVGAPCQIEKEILPKLNRNRGTPSKDILRRTPRKTPNSEGVGSTCQTEERQWTPRENDGSCRKRTFSKSAVAEDQPLPLEARKKTPRKTNADILEANFGKENAVRRRSPRKSSHQPLERTPCKELVPTSPLVNSARKNDGMNLSFTPKRSPRKSLFQDTECSSPIKTPLKIKRSVSSPRRSPRKLSVETRIDTTPVKTTFPRAYTISAVDVLSVVDQMSASARNLRSQESTFPLHQKLLICTLMLLLTKGNSRDINVGKLHEVYGRICGRRGMTAVDQSAFVSLCRQVEMAGGLQIGKGPARLAKVSLQWDETEVAHALKDSSLLTAILSDTQVLKRK